MAAGGFRERLRDFLPLFYAVLTRLLFFVHGFMSVWLLVHCRQNANYWWLIAGIVMLAFEMTYTLLARKGQEFKYFWPSCFFYMATMIPVIWIVEIEQYRMGMDGAQQFGGPGCLVPNIEDFADRVCKLGLIIGIIIGRWLLPRGEITRDQLSALLLGYVGTAADILELFEVFGEPSLQNQWSIMLAVLVVYSFSLLQFCLVTTATTGKEQIKIASNKVSPDDIVARKISLHRYGPNQGDATKEKYIQRVKLKRRQTEKDLGRGKGFKGVRERKVNPITMARAEVKQISRREMLLHGDIFGIMTGIFMQDGPFLILRLVLIIEYNVNSEMHIFFTCKNAIALSLLVYRLCILTCSGEDFDEVDEDYEQTSRLQNVQQAVYSDDFQKTGAIQLAG